MTKENWIMITGICITTVMAAIGMLVGWKNTTRQMASNALLSTQPRQNINTSRTDSGLAATEVTKEITPAARLRFTVFVFIGILPLSYNLWWLSRLLLATTPIQRLEVFAIFFASATIIYWSRDLLTKLQTRSLTEF